VFISRKQNSKYHSSKKKICCCCCELFWTHLKLH